MREPGELTELRTRVTELEVQVEMLRRRHESLAELADRIVEFLRAAHGEDFAVYGDVERAAEEALGPDTEAGRPVA